MHITLTGNLGSGKSTICKILENESGFEIYSTGKVQRSLAAELGISVLEMNQLMCTNHKYDKMIDDATARISKENLEKDIVFDSRLAWNFVETSFRVFLSVSLDVAAERVYNDNRGVVEKYSGVEDAKIQLNLRAETENTRYRELYKIEYFDFSNYNLVLDSTFCTPEILTQVMLREARAYDNRQHSTKILMSPQRLGVIPQAVNSDMLFYPEGIVKIRKTENDYGVLEGMNIVEKAAKNGIPFVQTLILV